MAQSLGAVAPHATVLDLPAWETLPHERLSPSAETVGRRIRTLENSLKNTAMAHRSDMTTAASASHVADSPVDKSGKTSGEPADVFSPSDAGDAGGGDSRRS